MELFAVSQQKKKKNLPILAGKVVTTTTYLMLTHGAELSIYNYCLTP